MASSGSSKQSIRESLVQVVSPSSPFDKFILAAIMLNSIALARVDYSHVDESYQPRTNTFSRNKLIEKAEYVFTDIFTSEMDGMCWIYHAREFSFAEAVAFDIETSQSEKDYWWIYWVVARTCQCDGAAVIHVGLLLGLWLHSGGGCFILDAG